MTVKTKSTSEELFEHFLRVPIPSDSKPFDYVRKTHEIYKPKSFTTQLEWFSPIEKMPSGSDYILLTSGDDCFYLGALHPSGKYFYTDTYQDLTFEIKEIKYWAYLPEIHNEN